MPNYSANLSRGDAVTDTCAALAKPGGWDISADLRNAWNLNFSLVATTAIVQCDTLGL